MRLLGVSLVLLLTGGCSVISSLEGYTFDEGGADSGPPGDSGSEPDADVPPDAGPDADIPPTDAGPDAGPDVCGGCSGERPMCDTSTRMCVECLVSADCPSGTCTDGACQTVVDYALGFAHTCAGLEDGTVWCWGANSDGAVGDGSFTRRLTPTRVEGLSDTFEIAAGRGWTCAKSVTNQIRCWGSNETDDGSERTRILGASDVPRSPSPVLVAEPADAIGLVGGNEHACYRTSAGEAFCWGINWAGQLGDGTTTARSTPVRVEFAPGTPLIINRLAGGGAHTCGYDADDVFCWGYNDFGQLGDGGNTSRSRPNAVLSPPEDTVWLGLGGAQSCAAGRDGVFCWGDNPEGRLGDGTTISRNTPVSSFPGSGRVGVESGSGHTCAWSDDGLARCWGDGGAGQYGDGSFDADLAHHEVALTDIASLQAGHAHTCALTNGLELHCWGFNESGQLGDGSTSDRPTPVRVIWP